MSDHGGPLVMLSFPEERIERRKYSNGEGFLWKGRVN